MLGEIRSPASLIAGLSFVCQGPADFRRGLEEACQTLQNLMIFAPDSLSPQVLAADDLGPCGLFLAATDRKQADQFAEARLGPLLQTGSTELLTTLVAFFESSRSVRRTSLALGVHENTVRYRLVRIVEVTGLDVLSDANDQLAAQVALLVLRLEMRLGSRSA
jgi:DNA-binding PucR family transcriptional regulator